MSNDRGFIDKLTGHLQSLHHAFRTSLADQRGLSRLQPGIRFQIKTRELIGIARRPSRALRQVFEPMCLVAVEIV